MGKLFSFKNTGKHKGCGRKVLVSDTGEQLTRKSKKNEEEKPTI